ncbi:hypothetical protein Taro_011459 [Colocasia esculenta]|uniref:Uncharacterized protein n=1 Tax=Colocasia esculenta TaxID=4460 RepID=A0A843UCM8_COLES|nr:hypothetical protein [Colocasia esculenta]
MEVISSITRVLWTYILSMMRKIRSQDVQLHPREGSCGEGSASSCGEGSCGSPILAKEIPGASVDILAREIPGGFLRCSSVATGVSPSPEIMGDFNRNCMINYSAYKNIFQIWALGEYRSHVLLASTRH